MSYSLGWNYEQEAPAKKAWTNSPPRFDAGVLAGIDISDAAFTLADIILWWYNQGSVGSCFANAVCSSIETSISFAVRQGAPFDEIQLSRRAVWYFGRTLDGSIGTRGDGGSITNAMRSIHEYGIPHEADWPYKPDHDWLEQTPPQSVMKSSKDTTIKAILTLNFSDTDGIKRSIKAGYPPVCGIYWTYSWDTTFSQDGIVSNVGGGTYGHALKIIGWAIWNGILYWNIQNSHGPIYPPLTPNVAAKVPGWAAAPCGKSYCFWVSDRDLQTVVSYGNAELVAPVAVITPGSAAQLSWLDAAS
jgi:hypothetical protein